MNQLIDLLKNYPPFFGINIVFFRKLIGHETKIVNYINGNIMPSPFERKDGSYIRHSGTENYTKIGDGCTALYRVDVTLNLVVAIGNTCQEDVIKNFMTATSKVATVRQIIIDQELIRTQEGIKSQHQLIKIIFNYTYYDGSNCITC